MTPITRSQKIYFAAVGLLALWVGCWGYFIPSRVDQAIPWLVPPLHARFLGAMYLSGAAFMVCGILARYYAEVRVMVPMIAIWTGMLFIVSLFYLGEFDYSRPQVWIWFKDISNLFTRGLWLMWRHHNLTERVDGLALPAWVQGYLLAQGVAITFLALSLLFAPELMVNVWPWKITRMLAQIYSAPFLSYGLGSLMLSRQQTWPEVRVAVVGFFVRFSGAPCFANSSQTISLSNLATWLWFGSFSLATLILGVLIISSNYAEV